MTCPHGNAISEQGPLTQSDIDSCDGESDELQLLAFYSACDCCDQLMHHSTCGAGYFVMKDGRTLCWQCAATEPKEEIDNGDETAGTTEGGKSA